MRYFTQEAMRKAMEATPRSDIDTSYSVAGKPTVFYFPFPEGKNTPAFPAVGALWKLTNSRGKQHVCGICRRLDLKSTDEAYFPICGPEFLKGAWDVPTMNRRLDEAASRLPKSMDAATFRSLAMKAVDFANGDGPCSFWRDYNSGTKPLGCKHVASIAFEVTQSGRLDELFEAMEGQPDDAAAGDNAAHPDELLDILARVCPAKANGRRKFPALIQGEHGNGKTFTARAFGDAGGFDAVIESHGHAGLEAIDFLGGMLPLDGEKSLAWVDGPVSEAFRRAANGQKVLLIADEIYRVPRRERSVFLTALSPKQLKDGTHVYRLKTGRPIVPTEKGLMPTMEILDAPEANLSIIGTTNVGPGYDVEDDDPAEGSRWHKINYAPGIGKLKEIVAKEAAGLKYGAKVAAKIAAFVKNVIKLRRDGEARLVPSTREMVRALHVAGREEDLPSILRDMAHTWVGLDTNGDPNSEQVKAVHQAIAAAFK